MEKAKRTGCGAIHVAGPLQFFDTKWSLNAGAEPVVEEKFERMEARGGPGGPPPMPDDAEMPMPGEMPAPGGEGPEFMHVGTGMPGSGMGGNTGLVAAGSLLMSQALKI